MSKITGFSLFFSSYAPLWVSVLYLNRNWFCLEGPIVSLGRIEVIVILLLAILSAITMYVVLCLKRTNGSEDFIITSAQEEDAITSEFLISCILPLFVFNFSVLDDVIVFLIVFSTLTILSIRHSHLNANVFLEMCGYRIYSCDLLNVDQIPIKTKVISKQVLSAKKGYVISVKPINDHYCFLIQDKVGSKKEKLHLS